MPTATPLTSRATPEGVVAVLADRPGTVWLDGGDAGPWSVILWEPEQVVTRASSWPEAGRALHRPETGHDPRLPFVSGVAGYVGYGAATAVGPYAARRGTPEPDVFLGRYPGALLYHHPTATWLATGRRQPDAARALAHARPADPPGPPPRTNARSTARDAFLARIARAQAWIAEGDCYQVNLSRVVHAPCTDPWDAWRRVRARSRPDRGAWIVPAPGVAIGCNSPERLLDVDGRRARTVPIKGTRPRGATPADDARAAAHLDTSAKERAELTMIVDLCRNDLGRVTVPGSVVAHRRSIVAYANVLHAEQPVEARLRDDADAWAALAALFPAGSVTGAPKVRATTRIAALEDAPRGVYCGAVGYVSDHGRAAFNVAIRTAVFHGGRARWHVGGGIVADSDPAAEWEETVAKGTVLAAAITGRARG